MSTIAPGDRIYTQDIAGQTLQSHVALVASESPAGIPQLVVPLEFASRSATGNLFQRESCLSNDMIGSFNLTTTPRAGTGGSGFALASLNSAVTLSEEFDWSAAAAVPNGGLGCEVWMSRPTAVSPAYLSARNCIVEVDGEECHDLIAACFYPDATEHDVHLQTWLGAPCWTRQGIIGAVVAVSEDHRTLFLRQYQEILQAFSFERPLAPIEAISWNKKVARAQLDKLTPTALLETFSFAQGRSGFLPFGDLDEAISIMSISNRRTLLDKITLEAKRLEVVYVPGRAALVSRAQVGKHDPYLEVNQWLPLLDLPSEVG